MFLLIHNSGNIKRGIMGNFTTILMKQASSLVRKTPVYKKGTPFAYAPKYQNSVKQYSELLKKENIIPKEKIKQTAENLTKDDLKNWGKVFDTKSIQLRFFGADTDKAYHGSPFSFSSFNIEKIGSGEGLSKRGKGIYLFRTKRNAPYFANIRSKDAPIHIGSTKPLDNPQPTIYEISGLKNLKLKKVSSLEAKQIASNQDEFMKLHPDISGIELDSGEICVFPNFISKIKIENKTPLETFITQNKDYNFRTWTTDIEKLKKLTT